MQYVHMQHRDRLCSTSLHIFCHLVVPYDACLRTCAYVDNMWSATASRAATSKLKRLTSTLTEKGPRDKSSDHEHKENKAWRLCQW